MNDFTVSQLDSDAGTNAGSPRRSQMHREMDALAVTQALWLAMKLADDAGFDSLVEEIGRIHLCAVRSQRRVQVP